MAANFTWTIGALATAGGLRLAHGDPNVVVTDLTDDSRTVKPGALFIARRGTIVDGRQFALDAINRGAVAVLCATESLETGKAALLVPLERGEYDSVETAQLAEVYFGLPSQHLAIIGITGTNGKTTTAYLVQQLLNSTTRRCGLMGTVVIDDGLAQQVASLTTPSAIDISRTLARMVHNGCTHLVMEVSSHALEQRRASAIHFDVGLFTNLSGDHLDYHVTMDDYRDAKKILFDDLSPDATAIVNGDDTAAAEMIADCKARIIRTTIGAVSPSGTLHRPATAGSAARATAMIEGMDATGTNVRFAGPFGELSVKLPLIGAHNVSNALQAACAAGVCGMNADQIAACLASVHSAPGRLEAVERESTGVRVFVDYAHTDGALDNVLHAVRPIVPPGGRLTIVFGCGGDRDRTKRPRMAAVCCQLADRIIITSDNPRTENPESIIDEIVKGVPPDGASNVQRIVDRRAAIEHAIQTARDDEIVLIAGKGHEDYQIIGTTKIPFDDRVVARQTLHKLATRKAGV